MAEFFKWDPAFLSVKVPSMDQEHQILISKMNKVYDAHVNKAGKDRVAYLVEDLATYVVQHFKDEEAFMEKINFDGLATHKLIHQQLLDQIQVHVEAFKNSGTLTDAFFKFLAVWLTSHIRGIDTKYGAVFSQGNPKSA